MIRLTPVFFIYRNFTEKHLKKEISFRLCQFETVSFQFEACIFRDDFVDCLYL